MFCKERGGYKVMAEVNMKEEPKDIAIVVLGVEEIANIRQKYDSIPKRDYEDVQKMIAEDFRIYRQGKGKKFVRFIAPRDEIKGFNSVLKKIRRKREEYALKMMASALEVTTDCLLGTKKSKDVEDYLKDYLKDPRVEAVLKELMNLKSVYNFENIEDLIGVKIICPYPSDTAEVISWINDYRGFCVVTPDKEARVETLRGYRGYHYTIKLGGERIFTHSRLTSIGCEVQIKTVNEEAWDAKTHELSYKKEWAIKKELAKHMKLFSDALQVVDEESEILKIQMEEEEEEEEKRRQTAATVYLKTPTVIEYLEKLGYNQQNIQDKKKLIDIANKMDEIVRAQGVNIELCKLAALLALVHNDESMEIRALGYSTTLTNINTSNARAYNVKGSICWALNKLFEAITNTEKAIELAEEQKKAAEALSAEDQKKEVEEVLSAAKINYAYWVGYAYWVDENLKEEARKRRDKALQYLDEFPPDAATQDTKGFLKIVFGETFKEVEEGRKLIREAMFEQATKDQNELACAFYLQHENLALKKLITILNKRKP